MEIWMDTVYKKNEWILSANCLENSITKGHKFKSNDSHTLLITHSLTHCHIIES